MQRPSVIFMNRVYPPGRGATGRMLRDLARSFAREGWLVTIITSGDGPEKDGPIKIIRVKGAAKPSNLGYVFVWLRMLWVALRQPKRHLMVTMTDPPLLAVIGQLYAKMKGSHHMHWCQDVYPDVLPALEVKFSDRMMRFFKTMNLWALRNCERVIVIGRCMARHLTLEGLEPTKITVVPNWPDAELVDPPRAKGNKDPDVHGAKSFDDLIKSEAKFRVLYAGNIGQAHPIQTILDAAEILNAEHPEIEFIFVGDGRRFDDLAAERAKRDLQNIRFLPYQPPSKLRQLMESGDVHLVSMKDEAAGYLVPCKLYSALAVQRPCVLVGPAQSETAKVIHDFKAGVVVAQGQAELLAGEIKRLRLSEKDWFAAHNGAGEAAKVFLPGQSIDAFIERAWDIMGPDVKRKKPRRKAAKKTQKKAA